MNDIFYEELSLLDRVSQRASSDLEYYLVEYAEQYSETHYLTEKAQDTLWESFKKFIATLISAFQTFFNNLTIKMNTTIKEVQLEVKLRQKRKELQEMKDSGVKTIEVFDIPKYKNTYLKFNSELWSLAKKFEKVKYKSIERIDEDLAEFNEIKDDFDKKLDRIKNKKIKMRVDEALTMVESEIDGTSDIMKTIQEATRNLKQMQNAADDLSTKRELLGTSVIPRHVGFLKRIANSITGFVKRHVVKLISSIVFLFA